jgi:hypothetical protein
MAWTDYDNPAEAFSGYLVLTSDGAGAISGAANSTEYVLLPLALLPNVSSAEAAAATGDTRVVCRGLTEMMYDFYDGLATADEPGKMTLTRSALSGNGDTVNRTWSNTFELDVSGLEVTAES